MVAEAKLFDAPDCESGRQTRLTQTQMLARA